MKQKRSFHLGDNLIGILLLSSILIAFCKPVYGQQELPDQIPPSPTSVAFNRYGDYPVGHYTGIPDITIPIFTIQEGDITMPISLSFHASGLRSGEGQGIIGPGWTLQAGGLVSRNINGVPDDLLGMNIPNLLPNPEYRYEEIKETYNNMNFGDYALDLYSYNILGKSGKYIPWAHHLLDPDGIQPWNPFKLKEDNMKIFDVIGGIAMADENGIVYEFGGTGKEEYQEFSSGRIPWPLSAISTWHLGSIYSSRYPGMGISCNYQQGRQYNKTSFQYILEDNYVFHGGGEYVSPISPQFPHSVAYGPNRVVAPMSNSYYTLVPQKITYSNGYLLFILDSSKNLDRIEIYNKHNQLLRTVQFVSQAFSSSAFRKLNALVFKDAVGVEQERYGFSYYGENIVATQNTDYWGFYNGQPYTGDNLFSIPNFLFQYVDIGPGSGTTNFGGIANREPDAFYAKTYMLERITYPTKGYTIFDYEGNRTAQPREIGGLRVKNISSYNAEGEIASQKSYSYISSSFPELSVDKDLFIEHSSVILGDHYPARRTVMSENPPVDIFPKGAPIGYNHVFETEGEITTTYQFDDNQAYTYDFLNNPGAPDVVGENSPRIRMFAHHYKPWNFGYLVRKEVSGSGLLKKEHYLYEDFIRSTAQDLIIYQHTFPLYHPNWTVESITSQEQLEKYFHNSSSIFNFTNRYHYSGVKRMIKKTTIEKNSDGIELLTKENYSYSNLNYPMQISSKSIINSREDSVKTDYKYANNFFGNSVYDEMTYYNRITEPIEQVEINVTKSRELSKTVRDYSLFNPSSGNLGTAQLSSIQQSWGGSSLETEVTVDRYDELGHIIQQKDKGGLVTSFIFGYDQQHLVAKIVGADFNTAIALVTPALLNSSSTTETDMRNHLSLLRTGMPGALVTIYTYLPGVGMSSETDPRGETIYYKYDNFQRLKQIKDQHGNIVKHFDYNLKP